MTDTRRLYELLSESKNAEEMLLVVERRHPDERLAEQLVKVGYLKSVFSNFRDQGFELTGDGLRALNDAQQRERQEISVQSKPTFEIHQTNHGTLNQQLGDHNTQQIQMNAGLRSEDLLTLLGQLHALVPSLPAEDQAEAAQTVERVAQALEEGKPEKLKRYAGGLLEFFGKSVEVGEKLHSVLKIWGVL